MSEPRRIYTRIVIDMTQDDLPVIESESYLHDGPVAMCMPSDGGRESGDGDRGSGGSTDSERGGSESGRGGDFGGLDYGSAVSGGLGIGGISDAVADTVGRESFGGLAGAARSSGMSEGITGLNSPADAIAGYASRRSVENSGYLGDDPNMSGQISSMTGKQVSRTTQGYVDDVGTRMAYSSGNPTSHGAAAAGRENNSMSWQGGSMMSASAQGARVDAKNAKAREIQDRVTRGLKDPMALGLDPHQALAAYNDAMHGMYDKAVAVGAMTPQEARTVQEAFGGIGGAFGIGLDDVTTPYESFVTAVDQNLVDPVTGKLTAKGWANVASPVLGMLAGPLTQLGFNLAGIPGAVVGALAPSMAKAAVSPQQKTGLNTAVNVIGKVAGVDMGPIAAGMSYADTMNTMSRAQGYAGTQPESVSGIEGFGGDESFLKGMSQFFTRGPRQKSDGTNPQFQKRFDSRFADRSRSSTPQPAQAQAGQPQVTKQSILGSDFLAGFKPFFRRA